MRVLAAVLAAHYLAAFTALGLPVFMPRVLAELAPGAPSAWVGALYVLPTLCTALTSTAWGRFADRHGRKLSLMRAQAGLLLGFALAGFAPNLGVFVLGLIVQGTCGGSMAAANAYLSTQSSGAQLSRALDWTQFSARLALVSAPALLGLFAAAGLGLALYRYLAVLPALALLITWALPSDRLRVAPAAPNAIPPASSTADGALRRLLALQFLFCFAMVLTFPYFLPYGEGLGLHDDRLAGLLYSLPHGVYLVAMPWLRASSLPSRRRTCIGLATLALACLAHALVTDVRALPLARIAFGVGMLFAMSGLNRSMGEFAAQRPAGRLFGAFDASGKWAGAVAGFAAGALVQWQGPASPFLVAAAASAIACAAAARPFRIPTVEGATGVTTTDP